ncbi:MAG: hypothetical protein WCO60_03320 [Verrucomicrobiota bacterium]
MSTQASEPSSSQLPVKPKRKRPLLRLLTVLVLAGGALLIPPVFKGVLWVLLEEEALRQGGVLKIDSMEGALWQPLVLRGIRWETSQALGGILRVEAESAEAVFRFENLLPKSVGGPFFELFSVKGVTLHWVNKQSKQAIENSRPFYADWNLGLPLSCPMPGKIQIGLKQWVAESADVMLKVEDTQLSLSQIAPGEVKAGRVDVQVRGWERSFKDVTGRTAIQGTRVQFGDMKLMDGVQVMSLVADLAAVGIGRVDLEMHSLAFGGELRVRAQASPDSVDVPLDASGSFSKLGVAPLAAFLGVTEAAGGLLEQGKFTFRGSPGLADRGTATLRLEARNFQWESRQWDSLVVGGMLLDRRVQNAEFSLQQGHNQLILNGEMQLPGGGVPWWKADFGMSVTARIDNLTELSALFMPEYKYMAGALTVDGTVRSQTGALGGALIVTGSKLKWRNSPIEELNAAVKLDGSDIRILNAELVNRADLLRGKGVIHVGDGWWYQGEFRSVFGNLGSYADLLQPPLVTEPYVGELRLDWTGRGTSLVHEGTVSGKFSGVHPLKPRGNWPHPLRGDFAGKYGKDVLALDSFSVGDEKVSLQGRLTVGAMGGRFEALQFKQGAKVSMTGDLSVPKALWDAWPSLDWAKVVNADLVLDAKLKMTQLDLSEFARLPGMPSGLRGEVSGEWESHGAFKDLRGNGALVLNKGGISLGDVLLSDTAMNVEWKARALEVRGLGWTSASGKYEGSADLEWKDGHAEPTLNLQFNTSNARWLNIGGLRFPVPEKSGRYDGTMAGLNATGRAEWKVVGPFSQLAVSGEVLLNGVDFGGVPDLRVFWAEPGQARKLALGIGPAFMGHSKLQLRVSSAEGLAMLGTPGTAKVDFAVAGTCAKPEIKGESRLTLKGSAGGSVLMVDPLLFRFEAAGTEPQVEIRGSGIHGKSSYSVTAQGPLSRPLREYRAEPPLSPDTVRGVFEEGKNW